MGNDYIIGPTQEFSLLFLVSSGYLAHLPENVGFSVRAEGTEKIDQIRKGDVCLYSGCCTLRNTRIPYCSPRMEAELGFARLRQKGVESFRPHKEHAVAGWSLDCQGSKIKEGGSGHPSEANFV